jgi:predicted ATPase
MAVALRRLDASLEALAAPLTASLGLAPTHDASWAELDPRLRRERIRTGLLTLLQRLADERPLVLLIEDVHAADHETLAFLELLASHQGRIRLLALVTARTPFAPAWADAPNCTALETLPLGPGEAHCLAEALVGADPTLAPLKEALVRRSG